MATLKGAAPAAPTQPLCPPSAGRAVLDRRTLLRAAPVAAVAAAVPVAANPPPTLSIHPDAALLDAWDRYVAAWKAMDASTLPETDPAFEALYADQRAAAGLIEALPWRTNAGLAVKLRLLFQRACEDDDGDRAVIYGAPLPDAALGGVADAQRLAWSMLAHAEQMADTGA